MIRWLLKWDDAALHPWRTVIFMGLSGFLGGGLIGYFRFGNSIGYGVALGLVAAFVLGAMGWKEISAPSRAAGLAQRPPRATMSRRGVVRLLLPFIALGVATVAGAAAASVNVFLITLAAALAVGLVLRRFVSG